MTAPRILHYPGSKWSMSEWIISHMPPHTTYLEPFFGSGAVLFMKEPSPLETVNDIDGDVVNLFKVIRERPDELAHMVRWTPYSREEYLQAHEPTDEPLEKARRMLIRCWQSIRVKTGVKPGWKCRTSADNLYHLSQWAELPELFEQVSERLRYVQIENRPAIELIQRYHDALIYTDPPYVDSTRTGKMYTHEMDDRDHEELLDALSHHKGPVLLSGYANRLYDERLKHWRRETFVGQAVAGKSRIEVLWINPIAARQIGQQLEMEI